MKRKFLSIEIDSTLKDKLRYIAAEEERSLMGQIKYILKKYIEQFEKMDGVIELPEKEEFDEKEK